MPDLEATTAMSANAPMTLDEFKNRNGEGQDYPSTYAFGGDFLNWLNGERTRLERDYQTYLTQNNREYELAKINDARKWEEYMASTQYQRMAKDLQQAGLNPYLALSGGLGAVGVPSSSSGQYSQGSAASFERSKPKKKNDYLGKAMQSGTAIVTTAIRAIAMIAAFA